MATGGRTNGFDYLRIMLATAVILAHSRIVTIGAERHIVAASVAPGGTPVHPPLVQPIVWAVLPSFFALSGFLVAGSLVRSRSVVEFIALRVMRLIPALFVETVLAAFILGPLVTELPLGAYFTHPLFLSYPLNIVGDIHYFLPGVFTHNPAPDTVNQQLWTIPGELLCYVTVVVLSMTGLVRFRTAIPTLVLLLVVYLTTSSFLWPDLARRWTTGAANPSLDALWLSFLVGLGIFFLRDRIPLSPWLFGLSIILSYVLLWDGKYQYLAMIPVAYVTVYGGLMQLPKTALIATGDYSYGVYLYGFPLQQLVAYLTPWNRNWILSFAVSLVLAMAMGALSWHLVESRVLSRRKQALAAIRRVQDRVTLRFQEAFLSRRATLAPASEAEPDNDL